MFLLSKFSENENFFLFKNNRVISKKQIYKVFAVSTILSSQQWKEIAKSHLSIIKYHWQLEVIIMWGENNEETSEWNYSKILWDSNNKIVSIDCFATLLSCTRKIVFCT